MARPAWQLELMTGADGPLLALAAEAGIRATVLPFPRALALLGDANVSGPEPRSARALRLVSEIGRAGLPSLAYLRRLRKQVEESAPDLIHSNGFKMHIAAARAASTDRRLVWHIHDYASARPVMSRLMRAHANRPALAIANSESVAEDLRKVCGSWMPVATVHNAIDLEVFNPAGAAADLDALAGMPPAAPGTVKVGLVATMARWKGQPVFLRAIKEVAAVVPIRAYIVGGAIYQRDASQFQTSELRELAAQLGISGIVGFTGQVANPAQAMRALDVVVHASVEPEPFGLVVAEAMACGRATVVAGAGGVMEIVTPGTDALVHRPGDATDLAGAIRRLALDSDLRRQLGAAARLAAERRFSRDRLIAQILPLYENLGANLGQRAHRELVSGSLRG